MLSIEAARCAGFRDSLYFFRKNETILKINMTSTEKEQLITSGMISGSLRSRSVTVVSARNVYKIMGAKFVKSEFQSVHWSFLPDPIDTFFVLQMENLFSMTIVCLPIGRRKG